MENLNINQEERKILETALSNHLTHLEDAIKVLESENNPQHSSRIDFFHDELIETRKILSKIRLSYR